jgi:SAM-dependent methyltransferase
VDGIPVMLLEDHPYTLWVAAASVASAKAPVPEAGSIAAYRLDTLGISPEQRTELEQLIAAGRSAVDPVVGMLVGATNGILYKELIGKLPEYPIPELRLPRAQGKRLLDVGCSWGRWSIAAARKGYDVVGVDPSLGALLAAKRAARALGVEPRFVCADARYLPFPAGTFNVTFSYSVLQHFSKSDARLALAAMRSVLAPGGSAFVQMPNQIGVRCLYHQARRGFREAVDFEVRYWSAGELKRSFEQIFGQAELETDCFFGLGLQASDRALFRRPVRYLISSSELLRALSQRIKPLTLLADSLYVRASVTSGA